MSRDPRPVKEARASMSEACRKMVYFKATKHTSDTLYVDMFQTDGSKVLRENEEVKVAVVAGELAE